MVLPEPIQTPSDPPPEAEASGDLAKGQIPEIDDEGASSPYFVDELGDQLGSSGASKPL